jgi:hypothetical protein
VEYFSKSGRIAAAPCADGMDIFELFVRKILALPRFCGTGRRKIIVNNLPNVADSARREE